MNCSETLHKCGIVEK